MGLAGCLLAGLAATPFAAAQPYAYVPNYNNDTVTVVDAGSNVVVLTFPVGDQPGGIAVNRDGTRVYIANRGSATVSVFDADSQLVVATIPVGTSPVSVALSPDGLEAYVANNATNNVSVIDTTSDTVVATIPVGSRPQGIAFHPNGQTVYVTNNFADTVSVVDSATRTTTATIVAGDGPIDVEVDPSGEKAYVANNLNATVSVIDTATNTNVGTIAVGNGPSAVVFSPDGALAYVGNFSSSTISVITTGDDTVGDAITVSGGIRGLSIGPNGNFLYAATQSNNRLAVVNAVTRAIDASIPTPLPRPLGNMLPEPQFGRGEVGAGHYHTCRVRPDASADCWGRDDFGQAQAPVGSFRDIVGGSSHSCGLQTDGTVVCWGNNSFGQSSPPIGVFTQITAGFRHTCGLRPDESVECWGDDAQGQATAPAGSFGEVRAGSSHTCAIDTSGAVQCWGRNVEGQGTAPIGSFQQLALGASSSCGLRTDGTVECWGLNDDGQTDAPGGSFRSIAAEAFYYCGIQVEGQLECWGANDEGQTDAPGGNFLQLATGRSGACALGQDGTLSCWGANAYSQHPQMAITPATLPAGEVAEPYSATLVFAPTNPGLRPPYAPRSPVWLIDGALPPGLSFDGVGNLSGTPTTDGTYGFTVAVEDANGFAAEVDYSLEITLSPPVITPVITGTLGTNGWYIGNVSLSWTVVDPETPVTSTTGCGPATVTVNTAGTDFTCSATSDGGTAEVTVTIRLDKTRPLLAPTISNNRPLLNNGTVFATPNASDALSGVASQSCAAADTSSVGSKLIVCTATDVAGNTATRNVGYLVIYGFQGFTGGVVNPGLWNSALVNQPIQAEYRIIDANGNGVTGLSAPILIPTAQSCPANIANTTTPSIEPVGLTDLGNGYYRMVWLAPASPACERINFNFGDGQTNNRLLFRYF